VETLVVAAVLGVWLLVSALPRPNFLELCQRELLRIDLPRLYEKSSSASEPPRHEADHGSVHERLATRTQPLVILAHPPLLVDPCQCPLHLGLLANTTKPLGGNSLRHSTVTPSLAHSLERVMNLAEDAVRLLEEKASECDEVQPRHRFGQPLVILHQPPKARCPREIAFHHPSPRQ
jgi:hypothetical protein